MRRRSVGSPVPRKEGLDKVAGRARYVYDRTFPGMLYGLTIRSTIPCGEILGIQFDFDTNTGAVLGFNVITGPCSQAEGYVGLLAVQGPGIEPGSEFVSFGDGWVSSGDDSCTTRLIGGKYYTVCR